MIHYVHKIAANFVCLLAKPTQLTKKTPPKMLHPYFLNLLLVSLHAQPHHREGEVVGGFILDS